MHLHRRKLKYVFFIKDDAVARMSFRKLLDMADIYSKETDGKNRTERREIAESLMKKLIYV